MTITESLTGKSILITGATGFLGKPIVEKILREVPDVEKIYLLIRSKKRASGEVVSAGERIEREFIASDVFDRLREERADFESFVRDKLAAVAGDVAVEGLDLATADFKRLTSEVDIIINSAAVVVFDERLDFAVQLNALGPLRLLQFAKQCDKSPTFIHVSTAYVNGQRQGQVPELLFEPGSSIAQELMGSDAPEFDLDAEVDYALKRSKEAEDEARRPEMLERFHRQALKELGPGHRSASSKVKAQAENARSTFVRKKLVKAGMERARLHGWHDTYTFTKAMGEQFLLRDRGDVPLAIVRPAIIESSLAEPNPGWIDGFRMADPLIVAFGKGRLNDFPGDPNGVLDVVPVDCVVNVVLAAIPHAAESTDVKAFHVATGTQNPVRLKEVENHVSTYFTRTPMLDSKGEPIPTSRWTYPSLKQFKLKNLIRREIPLTIAEWATRNIPGLGKYRTRVAVARTAVERISYYADLYGPYVEYACRFGTGNTASLLEGLGDEEREKFNFDVSRINWFEYFNDIHIPGLKRHVMKMETAVEDAPLRQRKGKRKPDDIPGRMLESGIQTIQELYTHSALRFGSKTAFQIKRDGNWCRFTFQEARELAGQYRTSLTKAGLKKGDRLLLLSESKPEWGIGYLGATSLGLTVVPVDRQTPADEVLRVADFVETQYLLVSPPCYETLKKQAGDEADRLEILNLDNFGLPIDAEQRKWPPYEPKDIVARAEVEPDDLASIIFTSGTTVEPKGVMLTHRNFISNVAAIAEVLAPYETDQFLSVLPMNHALEFTGGFLMPIYGGACVTYVSALKSRVITDAMQETGTTCMIGVPRLYKLFHDGITKEIEKAGALAGGLVGALKTVSAVTGQQSGRRLFSKIHQRFGGKIRVFVSGGAALDPAIFDDFRKMGFPICEGYGLTETSPVLTVNPLQQPKSSSVGPPLPNVEIRLDNVDANGIGEIVARGPSVMRGYYKNEDATADVLRDGWFRTGDLGRFDEDGYLYITGRVKDLVVTPAGKNVYPDEVELLYRDLPKVKEMTVLGVHSEEGMGEELHLVIVPESRDEEAHTEIREAIKRISRNIPTYQRVQKAHFWDQELPKTPSLKVKRNEVRQTILGHEQGLGAAEEAEPKVAPEASDWEDGLRKFLSEMTKTPIESIRPDSDLQYDLGMDSLAKVEFLVAAENRYRVKLAESLVSHLHLVEDAIDVVKHALDQEKFATEPESADQGAAVDWSQIIKSGELPPEDLALIERRGGVSTVGRPLLQSTLRFLCRTCFSAHGAGLENLAQSGPFLIAANHTSHLDSLTIITALPDILERLRILGARDYFFDGRIKGWFFKNYLNVLPFDRHENFLEGLRIARVCIEKQHVLLIFPEGTRSPLGEIQPFKVGLGIIAYELGVPIVPAWIQGTYEALPKGRFLPHLRPISVTFGAPISMSEFEAPEAGESRFPLYKQIVDRVRERIIEMSGDSNEESS